ncbi:catalase family peroxidase [Acidisoma cellulosilytica]|uniref:Catalase-related peroxidase n=1 Tax=Acidisoma cellulosilyticum TaxID=2802395 RepID=A0A964E3H0_9PROT|nr:catalase family peroxidase [Acidisoma cellulosilyticum]MCB8879843.1 catalase family peroxidase [Acidisoma cellulosilyticum]
MPHQPHTIPLSPAQIALRLAGIGAVLAVSGAGFAYAGGWFSPARLTPARIVTALADRGGDPLGHRRNHSKGVCFTGDFAANGQGAHYSTAAVLAKGDYPVTGRFGIATGNLLAADITGRVKSMAIRIVAPNGAEWRSGMNDSPVFAVATPQAFYEMTQAQDVDPATGKPDPAAMKHFAKTHPGFAPFAAWAKTTPWTPSWADQPYNSLNAFRFIDAGGDRHLVRWSMQPTVPLDPVPVAELAKLGPNYLQNDLSQRLTKGPLTWHLIVTLAAPGDPSNDATKAWPTDRTHVVVGTLTVNQTQPEANGPCRDLNYDPTILPTGIQISDDPLLPARSAAYAKSFDLRTSEAADYPRKTPAEGSKP